MPRAVLNGTVLAESDHRIELPDHDQPRPLPSLLSRLRREPTTAA